MNKISILSLLLVVGLVSFQCKKKKKDDETPDTFNKATLLSNVSNNLILPAYNQLSTAVESLEQSYITFSADLSSENLNDVRAKWSDVNKKWQFAKIYEFGPAMSIGLRSAVGTFPCDTNKVLDNISSGSYNLGTAANIDAIGVDALDFMLYRNNALSHFQGNSAYVTYGLELIQKIKSEINFVVSGWNSGYKATFEAGTGTESTSGFSYLVNEFCKDYELIKNAKTGIPLGKYSLGIQMPEYLEARQSALTIDLIRESVTASQRLFNGNSLTNTAGVGFDDYLVALDKGSLAASINNKYAEILLVLNSLTGTFEENMTSNPAALDQLYQKLSEMVVMIKTDMSSSFGVLITYQDNDGD